MNISLPSEDFSAIAMALRAVKERISLGGWADAFCASAPNRGVEVSGFIGAEFDLLALPLNDRDTGALAMEVRAALQRVVPRFKLAVLTMARDEALNLAEWVAHVLHIGVEHIFAYTNDNTDGTDSLLRWFRGHAPVSPIFTTAAESTNIQLKNYEHALLLLPELYLYEWVLVIDVDEFVVPASAYGNQLPSFLDSVPQDAGAVLFPWNWRLWQPHIVRDRGLLCECYQHAVPHALFKSAVRPHQTESLRTVHHPVLKDGARIYDSVLQNVAESDIWINQPKSFSGGWIDHYWGRSFEEFLIKKLRGDALNIPTGQFKREYDSYFHWTQPITPENHSPVPEPLVSGIKQRLEGFRRNSAYAALSRTLEEKYQARQTNIKREFDVERLFHMMCLPETDSVLR